MVFYFPTREVRYLIINLPDKYGIFWELVFKKLYVLILDISIFGLLFKITAPILLL